MPRSFRNLCLALSSAALIGACATPTDNMAVTETPYQSVQSAHDFATTEARFRAKVDAPGGPEILSVVDHGAGAAKADLALPPTKLFLIGNPEVGTPLMQTDPQYGLMLPLHVLIYTDAAGATHLAYQELPALAAASGLEATGLPLRNITDNLRGLLVATAGTP